MNERGQAGRGLANRVARAAVPVHLTGGVRLLLCEFSYAEDSAATVRGSATAGAASRPR